MQLIVKRTETLSALAAVLSYPCLPSNCRQLSAAPIISG